MSHDHHTPSPDCLNCETPLKGGWCHHCGQKASAATLSVHDVAHEAVHEFVHLDGKIVQTLKLLVLRPGQLTREFIAGRRARYISPLRLYLTCSVLFFALTAIVPGARHAFIKVSANDPARQQGVARSAAAEKRADDLGRIVMQNIPRATFVLMPVFALFTWALFRKQQRYYVPHLYYSVHFHAFVFLMMAVATLLALAGRQGKAIGGGVVLVTFPYHFLALRRTFGGSTWMVVVKGAVIGLLYLAAVTCALMVMVKMSRSAA